MKKIMIVLMMLLILTSLHAYTIETSRGNIELTIPDGYSLEEAYCQMAKLYLEERWDHEKLLTESKETSDKIEEYIVENTKLRAEYEDLYDSYQKLSNLYSKATKVKFSQPYIGGHIGTSSEFETFSGGLDFGVLLFEKIYTYTSVSVPWQFTLGVNFKI